MSLTFDGFWQSALAYEPLRCVRCDTRFASDDQGYCGCCHRRLQAELDEGWRALGAYLGNWAAFRDWETT